MINNYHVNIPRLVGIDILRGFAAFAVFLFHANMVSGFPKRTLLPFSFSGHEFSNIPNLFSFGATGVNLFFVLSGFCLSLKPLMSQSQIFDKKSYYRDRFARIYPAYFVAVLFSLIVAIIINSDWNFFELFSVLGFMQGFIQKWHFSLNGALWSMSTEIQFYIAFPFLFMIFLRLKSIKFILLTFILAAAYRFLSAEINSADLVLGGIRKDTFFMNMLPGRLFEFSLGILLAHFWLSDKNKLAKLCRIIFIPVLIFSVLGRIYFTTAIVDPLLGLMCALLIGLIITSNVRLHEKSLLASFGRSSYSFFLLHMPILILCSNFLLPNKLYASYTGFIIISITGLTISVLLGALLYNFVEKPFLQYFKERKNKINLANQ